jgi:4-amino-4-deoxy-L-arabinose transferase-like glycosyltransferase
MPRATTLRALFWIVAAALALVTTDLGGRILATNDEARFALLAQDILVRGDWLHPKVNEHAYYNKPPLQAWLIAAVSWPGGHVTQTTAVLPSAAAALAVTLSVWALGRRLFGTDAARAAALAFITMQGVFLHARLPLPDMLLLVLVTLSLWTYTLALQRGGRYWLAFYGLVGAACWAKGVVGLLPLAVAVVDGVLRFKGDWWRRIEFPRGLVVALAVMAPWWIVAFSMDRAAVHQAIVVDQLQWYAPTLPTLASVMAPFPNVVGVVFPWVIVLPLVVAQAVRVTRGRGAERDHVVLLLAWTLVTLVLVGLSHEQRMRYYLPLAPPVALLIGWWYAGSVVKHRPEQRVRWRAYATVGVSVAVLAIAVSAVRPRWRDEVRLLIPDSTGEAVFLLAALGLMLLALALGVRFKRLATGFAVAWVGAALLLAGGYHWALVRRNAAYDYPRMYAAARPMLRDVPELQAWGTPALPLAFYFERPVTAVKPHEALPAVPPDGAASVAVARVSLLEHDPSPGLVVVGRDRLGTEAVALVRREARDSGGVP